MPYSTYLPEHMGSAVLTPPGPFVAGSYQELTIVYTAGTFGIDDTGMLKISWRTTSDMSKPQFDKPGEANYTTVVASNGAKLDYWFDRLNIRPFMTAGVLRKNPNIKWTKDRGHEPQRPKDRFPWFWSGDTFKGERLNDIHLTNAEKQAARNARVVS